MSSLTLMKNDTGTQKEAKSHASITNDVKDGSDQTIVIVNPYASHHVAHLRNDEISKHSLDLPLRKSKKRSTYDRHHHQPWHPTDPDIRFK